jgi:hypothetical protein
MGEAVVTRASYVAASMISCASMISVLCLEKCAKVEKQQRTPAGKIRFKHSAAESEDKEPL